MKISKKFQPQVKTALASLAMVATVAFAPVSNAALASFSQDFDGWKRYTSVWIGAVGTGTFLYITQAQQRTQAPVPVKCLQLLLVKVPMERETSISMSSLTTPTQTWVVVGL